MAKASDIGTRDNLRNWHPVKTIGEKDAGMFDTRPDGHWLNPISMGKLQNAVRRRKDQVVLSDGVTYSITYGIWSKSTLTPPYECILLKRADGQFGSLGYISIKRIMDFDFEKGK